MTLAFRHLDVTPQDPVEEWGTEGVLTAIDRGGLAQWRQIIAAIESDPFGEVARDVQEALDLAEDRGVVATMRRNLHRARLSHKERFAVSFRSWADASGMTREELAAWLGTSRTRLSTYINGSVTPNAALAARLRERVERRREIYR